MSGFEQWMPGVSGFLSQWIPGFNPATATFALPWWAAAAGALLVIVLCLLAFRRAGPDGMAGGLSRISLILIGVGAAWLLLGRDVGVERRTLDARASELAARAIVPGSPLACLDGTAGDTVEVSCEKALFATPETTAAAVSYVAAQLVLLADATEFAHRGGNFEAVLANLRHAAETDRFGIVAHVLSVRDGCVADQCRAFALLRDASRVNSNLNDRTYEVYVVRHSAGWPAAANAPMAAASPPASAPAAASAPGPQGTTGSVAGRTPPGNLFFPSSASIPPVSIMNAEPSPPAAPPAPAAAPPEQAAKPPTPSRKPPAPAQQAKRPTNLNPPPAARSAQPAAPPAEPESDQ
jgi:hypothetical protein